MATWSSLTLDPEPDPLTTPVLVEPGVLAGTSAATEDVDGAATCGLDERARSLVAAFMRGVHRTAPLRFDHPGLDTMAIGSAGSVVLRTDLGGDGHGVTVHVDAGGVRVLHTDVHLERMHFFRGLLDGWDMSWSEPRPRHGDGTGHDLQLVLSGTLDRCSDETLVAFLEAVGSRLVFLIDWQRARRRLGSVIGKREAVALLRWAADHDVGHMAFLKLGGERLIYDAVELASQAPARFGQPLREVLGDAETVEVLRFALWAAAEGLLRGKTHLLIRDELRAELVKYFHTASQGRLDAAVEHAALIVATAAAVGDALQHAGTESGGGFVEHTARRGREWEHRADELVNRVRAMARRAPRARGVELLLAGCDDAMDHLEEVLFLLTLLPPSTGRDDLLPVLRDASSIVLRAAEEHRRALECARLARAGATGEEMPELLEAVDAVVALEHDMDDAGRRARRSVVLHAGDFRTMHVATEVCRGLEDATDALCRAAIHLREHVMHEGGTA